MEIGFISIVLIVVLVILLGLGTPISFCVGFLGVVGILIFLDVGTLYQIAEISADSGTNLFMLTLPLFILMAEVVSFSGVGDDMYTAAHNWLSWLPGGLAISSIVTCTGFAAISGSSAATAASVGLVSIPEMIKLQEKFGEKGLVILGISMDDPQMVTDEQLRVFKEKVGINYSVLRVSRQVLQDYFGNEQISIPTMFVVDRDGKIRDKLVGFRPGALEKSVSEIL